jgi:hypothetical protein
MNTDTRADIITVPQAGAAALVRIWDGNAVNSTAANSVGFVNNKLVGMLNEWYAMPTTFRGGISLTVAISGLGTAGRADLIVGAGAGGNSLVQIFTGASTVDTANRDKQLKNVYQFRAYTDSSATTAPVRLTTRDVLSDGSLVIITAQGANGRSHNLSAFWVQKGSATPTALGSINIKGPTTAGGLSL